MRKIVVLLIVAALGAAGCIGTVEAQSSTMELREKADEQAAAWDEDAQLVGVFGLEMAQPEGPEDDDGNESSANGTAEAEDAEADEEQDPFDQVARTADEELKDGQAPAWLYSYQAGNRSYHVAIAANGTILAEETERDDDRETPIEDWEVDSDEAADVVAENNETWSRTDDARSVMYGLGQNGTEEDPVWFIVLFPGDAAPIVYTVNATTGEYLGAHSIQIPSFDVGFGGGFDGDDGGDGVPEEGGSDDGSVSLAQPTAEHTFEVEQDGHPELGLELSLDDPATSSVTATIEGPDGTLGTIEADSMEPAAEGWWADPQPGEYTVTVELQEGATQDYAITWCAEGESYGFGDNPYGPDGRSPCDPVDGERGPGLLRAFPGSGR